MTRACVWVCVCVSAMCWRAILLPLHTVNPASFTQKKKIHSQHTHRPNQNSPYRFWGKIANRTRTRSSVDATAAVRRRRRRRRERRPWRRNAVCGAPEQSGSMHASRRSCSSIQKSGGRASARFAPHPGDLHFSSNTTRTHKHMLC